MEKIDATRTVPLGGNMTATEVSSKGIDDSPTEMKKSPKGFVPGVVLDSTTRFADFGLPEC